MHCKEFQIVESHDNVIITAIIKHEYSCMIHAYFQPLIGFVSGK